MLKPVSAAEVRGLRETILYRLLRFLPFVTPALARAAAKADHNKPENARVILKRLELAGLIVPAALRLIAKPCPMVGRRSLCRIEHDERNDRPADALDVLARVRREFLLNVPQSLEVRTVRVWRWADERLNMSSGLWTSIQAEQNEIFHSSRVGQKTLDDGVNRTLIRSQTTAAQNLGFVFLRLVMWNEVWFEEGWDATRNTSRSWDRPPPLHISADHDLLLPVGWYRVGPHYRGLPDGAAVFARLIGAEKIGVLFSKSRARCCLQIW